MTWTKRKKIVLGVAGGTVAVSLLALFIAARHLTEKTEPFLRDQTVTYLRERFHADVDLKALRIHMPRLSPVRMWRSKGVGTVVKVEGDDLTMRRPGSQDILFSLKKFAFQVDLGTVLEEKPIVKTVAIDGMIINVPPKGKRNLSTAPEDKGNSESGSKVPVKIEDVQITSAVLSILPKDPQKKPLVFDIAKLHLKAAPNTTAMNYEASLTNPKPPGQIDSNGSFGPWAADEPSDTPLQGHYVFKNANLGVFKGIAGILQSTGEFEGTLSSINTRGVAKVPDFRLSISGNPVPLVTHFEALVDGTNGNTVLRPVRATLGSSNFTTSGGIIKHEGDRRRSISLDVNMPNADMRDILRLATKGSPFMEGRLNLKTKLDIPPLSGKVREKLRLNGKFAITDGRFLKSTIQDQIDSLSRRGQGQPSNEGIDQVVSGMSGAFHLENEKLTFSSLKFGVPGADVSLAGLYNMHLDELDFHGKLRLKAKVSQTMTGWKRWALKPVDPFFAKEGAGTVLPIQVVGTSKQPKFGYDRGKKDPPPAETKNAGKSKSS